MVSSYTSRVQASGTAGSLLFAGPYFTGHPRVCRLSLKRFLAITPEVGASHTSN